MSTSTIPSKRTWHDSLFGSYIPASPELADKFACVASIDFSETPTSPTVAVVTVLFRLTLHKNLSRYKYCLLPIGAPDTGEKWDTTFLSAADLMVWKVAIDLSISGGGLLLELVGTLREATLPAELCAGPNCTKIRLDTIPAKFLVGLPDQTTGLEAAQLIKGSGSSSSLGSAGQETAATLKHAGVVVTDLNGDPHKFRSKAHSADRVLLMAGPLRESNRSRLTQLMTDLEFIAADFRDQCQRHAYRPILVGDELHSLSRIREVDQLPVWLDDIKLREWYLGLDQGMDWAHSLADFLPPGSFTWGPNFDHTGLQKLIEAANNYIRFQRITKGEAFAGAFVDLQYAFEEASNPLSRHHVEYVWAQLEDVIRSYHYEIRHTEGRVSKVYCPGQPIASQADCVAFLQLLMHNKMNSLRDGQWESAPHPHWYAMIYPRIRNRPAQDVSVPPLTHNRTCTTTPPVLPSACHKDGLCFWYLAGSLGLTGRRGSTFRCLDSSHPHVPLNTVRYQTVRRLLKDDDFMATCHSIQHKDSLRAAVKTNKSLFLP